MPKAKVNDGDSKQQAIGHENAYRKMLVHCLEQLGYKDPLRQAVVWASERAAALAALRKFCEILGLSADWEPHIRLATVIEKHILPQYQETERVDIPVPLLNQLRAAWGSDFSRHNAEALAFEGARTGALSAEQVAEFLDLTQGEAEVFLKERGLDMSPGAREDSDKEKD